MHTGLFSGDISQALGLGNSLADRAENALIVAVIGLPGYYLSVAFLEKIGRKRLQLGGFAAIAVLFFIIGGGFDGLRKVGALLLILYGMTFLFSNFGPNATTYIIPGEFYPPEVRATCHGLSAAAGKLGAAVAAYIFPHLKSSIGVANLLLLCGGVGTAGVIWTALFVPDYTPETLDECRARYLTRYHARLAAAGGDEQDGDGDGDFAAADRPEQMLLPQAGGGSQRKAWRKDVDAIELAPLEGQAHARRRARAADLDCAEDEGEDEDEDKGADFPSCAYVAFDEEEAELEDDVASHAGTDV